GMVWYGRGMNSASTIPAGIQCSGSLSIGSISSISSSEIDIYYRHRKGIIADGMDGEGGDGVGRRKRMDQWHPPSPPSIHPSHGMAWHVMTWDGMGWYGMAG